MKSVMIKPLLSHATVFFFFFFFFFF
jgi:hypothetical protein